MSTRRKPAPPGAAKRQRPPTGDHGAAKSDPARAVSVPYPVRDAARALLMVLNTPGPADGLLHAFFRQFRQMGQRDRAFIAETTFGVLRHQRCLESGLPAATPALLLLGYLARFAGWSAQRLAPFASAGDLAVLAQLKALRFETLPLAVRAELPDWVVAKLQATHAEEAILTLGQTLASQAPLDLRVNTLQTTRDDVLAQLAASGITAQPTPYSPYGVRIAARTALQKHPLFLSGHIEIQDEGSQLLCALMAPRRGERVIDFCAGAGGKTLALGMLMQSHGRIYAFDVSAARLDALGPRLRRSGLSNVHAQRIVSENDIRIKRLAGKADRVLVDAPCSGLGTLRRNPDLKRRLKESEIPELAAKQLRLLTAAARLVKPGGRLVYGTCSILAEENTGVAAAFAASHPHFAPVSCAEILATQRITLDTGDYLELSPPVHGTDGFFAAVFEHRPSP